MDAEVTARKQKHVAEEYLSSLQDLQCNSKPLINMLTMLAEENIDHALIIVKVVEQHIAKVPNDLKLPVLYLIDSIVKNVKSSYVELFGECIVDIFCDAFEKVNEKIRERMYALRQTWNEVFPIKKLYNLDVRVKQMDKNWPITAVKQQPTAIHVNPNFLKTVPKSAITNDMEEILQAKTRELLELKKRKLELELEATKKHIEEQQKQLGKTTENSVVPVLDTHMVGPLDGAPGTSVQLPIMPNASVPTTLVNPALLAGQTQMPAAIMPAMPGAAGMYNQNYIRPMPRMPTVMGQQQGPIQMVPQMHPGVLPQANMSKIKVHPVNPALLNTIRHRDPRLMRQQQYQQAQQQQPQQQLQSQPIARPNVVVDNLHSQPGRGSPNTAQTSSPSLKEGGKRGEGDRRSSSKSSKSSRQENSNKSPTRHSSSSNRSSSHRPSKSSGSNSSSSSSSRDKDRDRRRGNESSSSKSYSSSNDRRNQKNVASLSSRDKSTKADIDLLSSPSSSLKHKKSPSSSPSKSKDSNRHGQSTKTNSNNSNSNNRNPSQRRSDSPDDIVSSTKDVDLRSISAADSSAESDVNVAATDVNKKAVKGLEQNIKKDFAPPMATTSGTKGTFKDVDLRQFSPDTVLLAPQEVSRTGMLPSPPPPPPPMSMQEFPFESALPFDPSPPSSSSKATLLDKKTEVVGKVKQTAPTVVVVTTSSSSTKSPQTPKVSFKIQKMFNVKLAKSTETLSTAKLPISTSTTATTTSSTSTSSTKTSPKGGSMEENFAATKNTTASSYNKKDLGSKAKPAMSMDIDDDDFVGGSSHSVVSNADGKKRISESGVSSEEPVAKKSKSAKMDALFGSEDVDLRTLGPPPSIASEVLIPPPPPNISSSEEDHLEENKNRDKAAKISKSPTSDKVPSNFEDVRAKLAKATRLANRANRVHNEKPRFKLSELNVNNEDESTQEAKEANDEKIRIILSQAQEMLESNSLSQEQYKQLVQTVMSINEKNKLKEAKRRESLRLDRATKESKTTRISSPIQIDDDSNCAVDTELATARDAVLRKRIPKIPKSGGAGASSSSNIIDLDKVTRSPIADKSTDDNKQDDTSSVDQISRSKSSKEKRVRSSKWSDRNESPNNGPHQNMQQQRAPWNSGPANKRGPTGMRTGPGQLQQQQQQQQPPMMMGGPLGMRPMHSGGGDWQNGPHGVNMPMPFGNQMPLVRTNVPPPPQPPMNLPPVLQSLVPNNLPKPCNSIDNPQAELVRTITIDGQSKDIRIYDDVAIVFMDLDQPREIGFQPGQRNIIIDNQEPVTLRFNDEFKPINIAGEMHRVRFGFPSRELYIDEHWYEIYFGGPPVSIPINNRIHILKAEGPPPQVNIGPLRRDLVVGKIHMIVEAVNLFPLFLDARIQTFRFENVEHTVQFADNLLTVLLDGQAVSVEYGGLPKSYTLGGRKYFIRFTTLPKGVIAGKAEIKDMIYIKTEPPVKSDEPKSEDRAGEGSLSGAGVEQEPSTIPLENDTKAEATKEASATSGDAPVLSATALGKINIDELFQKLVSSGILNNNVTGINTAIGVPTATAATTATSSITQDENSTSLEQKKEMKPAPDAEEEEPPAEAIVPIDLKKPESIKTRQTAIISALYSGMQCSSCGVRFPPEQTIKYSQHLDWHFRQNRRERDSTRKAHSRRWYYDLNDWLQYEEIEDLEEREKNFFETQQGEIDIIDDISNQRSTNSPVPTCAAGSEDVDRTCDMCQEKFEQFYNEELEEWHLRPALRVEDKIYHPLCYEDYKTSLNPTKESEDKKSKIGDEDVVMQEDDNAVDSIIKIEEDDKDDDEQPIAGTTIADEDDDVIVLPNEEPSVTEIVDDDDEEEYVPAKVTREDMGTAKDNEEKKDNEAAMESDVEIQEPNIPFTDLDTYEEKELPTMDESSQASFRNVKIKEEPKDDEEDEDDGFEDVGTVMYGVQDEISIQSSEDTQAHTIASSADSPITVGGERSSSANLFNADGATDGPTAATKANEEAAVAIEDSNNISMDGNLEPPADGLNLSIAGPGPAIPLVSLVNKIKINITKNIATSSSTSAASSTSSVSTNNAPSSLTTTTSAAETSSTTVSTNISNTSSISSSTESCIPTTANTCVVSTIPVLCGGGTTIPTSTTLNNNPNINNNVSNIAVIGSYTNYQKPSPILSTSSTVSSISSASAIAANTIKTVATTGGPVRQRSPTPPQPQRPPTPVEETKTYELKPALQKVTLKKMKMIESGVETSGLCSIM